jgi:hypothetical protein
MMNVDQESVRTCTCPQPQLVPQHFSITVCHLLFYPFIIQVFEIHFYYVNSCAESLESISLNTPPQGLCVGNQEVNSRKSYRQVKGLKLIRCEPVANKLLP